MRKSIRLLLVLAAVCVAQDEKPASVAGTVVNSVTGEPILRAHVILSGRVGQKSQSFGALTDAEGKFNFPSLPAGQYVAWTERIGFVRAGGGGPTLTLKPGDSKEKLELKLTPAGAIVGRVVDADGEPAAGVSVRAEGGLGGYGRGADDNGNFRLGGLEPGKYRVKAEPPTMLTPPEIRSDGSVDVHYAATWFPNAINEEGASQVEVQPGVETGGIEIRLVRAPNVCVSGTVRGVEPRASRAQIEVRQRSSTRTVGVVKPDGSFQVWGLSPGKYQLRAVTGRSDGEMLSSAPEEIDVGESNIENVVLEVVPSFDVQGRIEFEDEQPGMRPEQQHPKYVILRDARGDSFQTRPAAIAPDGSFLLEKLQPARYRVWLPGFGDYVKAVRLGSNEIPDGVLDFRNGAPGAVLGLVAKRATGEISGTVRDGNGPAAGARVILVAEPLRFARTGPGGTYSFTSVPPGKYKLATIEEADFGQVSRGSLDAYQSVVEEVEVGDGEKVSRDLKRKEK